MNELKPHELLGEVPSVLPVIPTMDVVVFPHMVVPLLVLDGQIIKGIEQALNESKKVLLLATKQSSNGLQGPISISDLHEVGTIANVMRIMKVPDGGIKVLIQGLMRASVEKIITDDGILSVKLNPYPFESIEAEQNEIEARLRNISTLIETMSASGKIFGPDAHVILSQIKNPEKIADFILSHLNLSVNEAQGLLEQPTILSLLDGIYEAVSCEIEIAKVQDKIQSNARESINKSQREYYLREQLRAIKKELGEDTDTELEELKERAAHLPLSDEARVEVDRQLRRLEKISPDSMETTVIRNYIDWVLALPWGKHTTDNLDIAHAKEVLEKDHYGLEDIKERILDYLSVRALKENCTTPILCFAGPPGVGKTSLGRSIAQSMGRAFQRISLGGVHDEAEIRGHRRTYVGSMPGRFIQAMRKAETCNPLIMIDEIDKIGHDHRGDPSAALLEILDPEQNQHFHDNYLGVPFDLSKVLFVATANDISAISAPLRDRMEIIQLSGYTNDEKIAIAERHLTPKAIRNFGLDSHKCSIPLSVINDLVLNFTREAGVRQLERLIQKLCSKYARAMVEDKKALKFTPELLDSYLGPRRLATLHGAPKNRIGVTTGLAWTPYGGELLQVEAVLMPGKGKLLLTGQLGDVMKESAQAAVTYAKARADSFGIPKKYFTNYDLHIHFPAGAIPKDGPSAGITVLSSVLSALTERPINCEYAMTGELNLRGEVLPIGGVKEKILAAKQEGLKNIILPRRNEQDLAKLGEVSKDMNIVLVDDVAEVLDRVLMPKIG